MEMRSFRRLLGISYREHITNEEVRSRIRQAIGPYKELLTVVKQRKLQWYGHITRSSGLAKAFLQGTVQGGRRMGRQRKRWEDNICEWTGLGLSDTVRKAEDREEWRRLVVTSCGAPTVHKIMGQIDRYDVYISLKTRDVQQPSSCFSSRCQGNPVSKRLSTRESCPLYKQ